MVSGMTTSTFTPAVHSPSLPTSPHVAVPSPTRSILPAIIFGVAAMVVVTPIYLLLGLSTIGPLLTGVAASVLLIATQTFIISRPRRAKAPAASPVRTPPPVPQYARVGGRVTTP